MIELAVIGPDAAGKSSLLRALGAKAGAQEVVVQVPDPTLEALARIYQPERVVPLQMGFEEPAGPRPLPPKARDAQGLVVVLGAFEGGFGEPGAQWAAVNEEMIVADLVVVEGRLERIAAERAKGRKVEELEIKLLERARDVLGEGRALREEPALAKAPQLRGFGLWSAKPVVVVVNLGDEGGDAGGIEGVEVVGVRCRLEAELLELEPEDREEFMQAMGIETPGAGHLMGAVKRAMDFITFYTVVGKEVRAWAVPRGTTAWEAAGEIHSDMQRGFIRAEVMEASRLIEAGAEAVLRKAGEVKVVSKEYELGDAEVFIVRFSV